MKHLSTIFGLTVFLLTPVNAESDPEMERLQRQLNCQNFGNCEGEPAKKPTPPPVAKIEAPAPAATSDLNITAFTGYKLDGAYIGMLEADALALLKGAGYQCNTGPAAAMKAYFPGHHICMYMSMESPRILHFAIAGGKLIEIEYTEHFDGGFPAGHYDAEKAKFLSKYPDKVHCKPNRRGERCDVLGHGYRISMRSKENSSKATLSYSIKHRR